MAMVMTNEEIVRMYREAKNKKLQVEILADLNLCKQEEIIEILKKGGVAHQALPRIRKKQTAAAPFKIPEERKPPVIVDKSMPFLKKNHPDPVTPRKDYEMTRIRELIRGIRDFASAWKCIDPEWIKEYNELVERTEYNA